MAHETRARFRLHNLAPETTAQGLTRTTYAERPLHYTASVPPRAKTAQSRGPNETAPQQQTGPRGRHRTFTPGHEPVACVKFCNLRSGSISRREAMCFRSSLGLGEGLPSGGLLPSPQSLFLAFVQEFHVEVADRLDPVFVDLYGECP